MRKRNEILFVFGTRPEALKLAPVILQAQKDERFKIYTCFTAQHRELVEPVLRLFKIPIDFDLDVMTREQSLGGLTQKIFSNMQEVYKKIRPKYVVVQGDTTTAFAIALQAFYEKISVAHVEAGLRSHDKYQPFPEEINRILISHLADYHFAPTLEAKRNLLREGIAPEKIFVTGNTIVDALKSIRTSINGKIPPPLKDVPLEKKIVLVTAHRRENFGKPLLSICQALKDLTRMHPEIHILYPVHLNPNVQKTVYERLQGLKGISLLPPLSYEDFLPLLIRCYLVLTDSGGIQEEAPSFGKPVLVLREVSERPDGIATGVSKIVGTSRENIVHHASRLIRDKSAYSKMVSKRNPYGDGKASVRILDILSQASARAKGAS